MPNTKNAFDLLSHYAAEFIQLAQEVGIDGTELLQQLPDPGCLLTGFRVPVIHPKYRYSCSVLLHINKTHKGQYWPLVRFHSFKHGGETRVFNGLKLLNNSRSEHFVTHPKVLPKVSIAKNTMCIDDTWRMDKFLDLSKLYFNSPALTANNPWLQKRLCGYATPALMQRTFIHQVQPTSLLAPLSHPLHGLVGYHKISIKADADHKRHYIFSAGRLKGSYIEIQPQTGVKSAIPALCEGLATGLTIALIWPGPIYIALSANNLSAVRSHLNKPVAIFCDNDAWKPKAGNVGKQAALTALTTGDRLLCPVFLQQLYEHKPSDFNDLLMLEGIGALMQQVSE